MLAGLLTLVAACKKNDDGKGPADSFDRKAMLTNYADNYIIPAYTQMSQELDELQTAINSFTSNPDASGLQQARDKWEQAYFTWQKVELLEFGPAEDVSLRMFINIYPVTVSKLNANIAAGNYDLEAFGNKDAQGFPAIDYLINGIAATDADILSQYTTDVQATARRKYLNDVSGKMYSKVSGVLTAWNTYRTTFVESTGTDAGSSFSRMVNSYVLYYERYLRSGKVGIPAGVMTGIALPGHTEAYYTPGFGNEMAVTAVSAVTGYYEGKSFDGTNDGTGMYDYLKAIATKDDSGALMADVIKTELDEAKTALSGLNIPLRDAVQTSRPQVLAIYDQLQEVVALLKVDMVSAFGISITYVDNDGD